jgi:hypothetical protein
LGKKREKGGKPLDDGDNLEYLEPYKGTARDELVLRREQG